MAACWPGEARARWRKYRLSAAFLAQFDVLYEEAIELPRVMSISMHPFISGHPFRMKHIEAALAYVASHSAIWQTTGGEISDWYRANCMGGSAHPAGH
jgi:hypothetical protein